MVSLKAIRSSPRSMASTCTPMTLTPYFSSTPARASSEQRFSPDCPPRLGSRASGRSFSMIWVIALQVQRLDVGHVGHAGVGHDGGGVRVHQHDLVAQAAQGLAGLRSGVVEFAGLADDDRPGPDDHDLLDVVSLWHLCSVPSSQVNRHYLGLSLQTPGQSGCFPEVGNAT